MNNRQEKILNDVIGNTVLLSIGINDYMSDDFGTLKKSCNDAKQVYNIFKSTYNLQLNDINSILLTSDKNETSKTNILNNIDKVCENVSADEKLVIYFSGHGHRISNDNYIVPSDNAKDTELELIMIEDILEKMKSSKSKRALLILDSCFSGVVENGPKGIMNYKFDNIKDYIRTSSSLALISSSSKNEESFEKSPNNELSLFTTFLVDALSGKEEALDGVYLTVNSLFSYVSENVRRISRGYTGIRQKPNLLAYSNGETILGLYRKLVLSDESDCDNKSEIKVNDGISIFSQTDSGIKTRINDELWFNTKEVIEELIINGFDHGNSNDVKLEISMSKIILKISGDKFDSIHESRKHSGTGLNFLSDYISEYKSEVTVTYNYCIDNGTNILSFDFRNEGAFDIKGLCTINVSARGYRRCEESDVELPLGKCKKYYYYLPVDNMCMSKAKSIVKVIFKMIPQDSYLIIVDKNTKRGRLNSMHYLAEPRLIYREC